MEIEASQSPEEVGAELYLVRNRETISLIAPRAAQSWGLQMKKRLAQSLTGPVMHRLALESYGEL